MSNGLDLRYNNFQITYVTTLQNKKICFSATFKYHLNRRPNSTILVINLNRSIKILFKK